MRQNLIEIAVAFWETLAEMAPWLIFGFLVAGVLSVFFSPAFIEKHLGGRGWWPVVKASVLGVPLPICSCGVIPVGTSLYRHGASRGATSSFLLSTPQTGGDSVLATYALMGPVFAVVRPVVALLNGVLGGWLIEAADASDGKAKKTGEAQEQAAQGGASCCSSTKPVAAASCCSPPKEASGDSCCGTKGKAKDARWRAALRYGLVTLPADIAVALLIGLVVAALLTALVPADALTGLLGGGIGAMLVAVVVGTPLYVCSTASIPVALGLMVAGASPGAALAFLIAGPATNAATVSVAWNVLGRRTGCLYLLSVVVTAVGAGLLLDAMFSAGGLGLPSDGNHHHDHSLSGLDHFWAISLLLLLVVALWGRFGKSKQA